MLFYLFNKLKNRGQDKTSKITRLVQRLFYTSLGQILISILFGLAIACMFQKVCKGNKCVVIEPPPMKEIEGYVFKIKDDCYEYIPRVIDCDDSDDD